MTAAARVVAGTLAAFATMAHSAATVDAPRPSGLAGGTASVRQDDEALATLARETLHRLFALSSLPGPQPRFRLSDDALPKAKAAQHEITATRRLLRLCADSARPGVSRPAASRDALIAFVMAHELAHLARRDPGSFGSRAASAAVEMDADEQAVRLLFTSGVDIQPLDVAHLLRAISRETRDARSIPVDRQRERAIRKALKAAQSSSRERHVGWLLSVAGRFDDAIAFYHSVATTYPFPEPMYVLAMTRLQAAWRTAPCDDPAVLEWLPPLRLDPRSQIEPIAVRSADSPCLVFRSALATAAGELARAPDHGAAQVALASVRLMQGDRPTLDPTAAFGGVTRIGDECPSHAFAGPGTQADACHVSLLSQYELSRRDPLAHNAAIAGLLRLHERSPDDPALQFNLARLLTAVHREAEAIPLWRAFLETATPGPYRTEAFVSLSRMPTDLLPALPQSPPPTLHASSGSVESVSRFTPGSKACANRRLWGPVRIGSSSAWSYCGEWSSETLIARGRATVVRSIAAGSEAWAAAEWPTVPPIFVITSPMGEEVRVWEEEAWVFVGKTPRRVVYFTKPQ